MVIKRMGAIFPSLTVLAPTVCAAQQGADVDGEGGARTGLYVIGGLLAVGGLAYLTADAIGDSAEDIIDCTFLGIPDECQ